MTEKAVDVWVRLKDVDDVSQDGEHLTMLGIYRRGQVPASVLENDDLDEKVKVTLLTPGDESEAHVFRRDLYECNTETNQGVADMTSLTYMEEPNLLHNLRTRFAKDEIYTNIAKVLVAVNPFKKLSIYSGQLMNKYRTRTFRQEPPHTYKIAEECYLALSTYGSNQSMIVSGESGAGKTESAKQLMRYMTRRSVDVDVAQDASEPSTVEKQVLGTNPILESFGNAKTVLNNNSSRFGKFTKMYFSGTAMVDRKNKKAQNKAMVIEGASTETYLLEKSRVVTLNPGERNYHVFYQICTAANPDRAALHLTGAEDFHYLKQGSTFNVPGINDEEEFKILVETLDTVKITQSERAELFKLLASILHIGNIQFEPENGDDEKMTIAKESKERLSWIASFLGVPEDKVLKRLTTQSIKVRREVLVKNLNHENALFNRDALSKNLYNALFGWVVYRTNKALAHDFTGMPWVGILDVFGFECFLYNSLEQFCINFANERLQQHFNKQVLMSEQDEYIREAIFWTPLDVVDNEDVIALVNHNTQGLISLLNTACIMPKATDESFTNLLFETHPSHSRLKRVTKQEILSEARKSVAAPAPISPNSQAAQALGGNKSKRKQYERINGFAIRHYAGEVTYNAKEFLQKNTDNTQEDTIELMKSASNAVVADLFVSREEEQPAVSTDKKGGRGGRKKGKPKSLTSYFQKQLTSLMTTLEQTTPYFVRCVKPNREKKADLFSVSYVRPQLRCGGLVEAVRMLKCGYPTRCSYEMIYERFFKIAKLETEANARDLCESVMKAFGIEMASYQLGLTKIFFRAGKQAYLDKVLSTSEDPSQLDPKIGKQIRANLIRKKLLRSRGVIKCAIRFLFIHRKANALQRFQKAAGVMIICNKTFIRRARNLRKLGSIKTIQAALSMYSLLATKNRKARSASKLQRFYRHNVRRRELQKEVNRRVAKKQQAAKRKLDRAQRIKGMTKAQIVYFDRMQDALEKLCDWTSQLTGQDVTPLTIFKELNTGVVLAKVVASLTPKKKSKYHAKATPGSFFARDNVESFLSACTKLGVHEDFLFQADFVMQPMTNKHEEVVIKCLTAFANKANAKYDHVQDFGVTVESLIAEVEEELNDAVEPQDELNDLPKSAHEAEDDTSMEELTVSAKRRMSKLTSGNILPLSKVKESKMGALPQPESIDSDVETKISRPEYETSKAEHAKETKPTTTPKIEPKKPSMSSGTPKSQATQEYEANLEAAVYEPPSEFLQGQIDSFDAAEYTSPEELQKYMSQLYSLALKNNLYSLIQMFSGFNNNDEEAMYSAFDPATEAENAKKAVENATTVDVDNFETLPSVKITDPTDLSGAEPSALESTRFERTGTANNLHRQSTVGELKVDRDELDGIVPIVDIQVLLTEKGEKDQVPEGYRVLHTTYSGRSANLNKGSKGRSIYLCYKRMAPTGPGKAWRRVGSRVVLEEERPITDIMVLQREFNETTRFGAERIAVTPGGYDADLNYGTKGHPIYLCVMRGTGPPVTAINLFVAKKNDPFPDGYRMVIHTPDKHVANVNRGSTGRVLFLLYRVDMNIALRPLREIGYKQNPQAKGTFAPVTGRERAREIYFSRVFSCVLASLYSTNEVLVSKALDVIGIIIRLEERLPLRALTAFLHRLCDLVASFSACFRKSSRVELDSVVLLLLHDIFNAYINDFDTYTINRIFETVLSFRPDTSRAALVRQMLDNVLNFPEIKEPKIDPHLLIREQSGDDMKQWCSGLVYEIAQRGVIFSEASDSCNIIQSQMDIDANVRQNISKLYETTFNNRNEVIFNSLFAMICKFCDHNQDQEILIPDENGDKDNHGIERRIHAMEQIIHTLDNTGDYVRSKTEVLQLIRLFVTNTMIRCCQTGVHHRLFFQRILQITVFLFRTFRKEFKMELATVVDFIMLGILKSENCKSRQKQDILEAVSVLFHQQQDLADCFYNFDNASSHGISMFETLVTVTSKIADGVIPSSDEAADPRSETSLRRRALENVVAVFQLILERVGENGMPPPSTVLDRRKSIWEVDFENVKTDKAVMEKALLHGKMGNLMEGLQLVASLDETSKEPPVQKIVSFLYENASLFDKDDVGRFLSSDGEYNSLQMLETRHHYLLLQTYFEKIDFSGMDFVAALRDMFQGNLGFYVPYELEDELELPADEEAAVLQGGRERLLYAFSKAYVRDNCGLFPSFYEAYRVSSALVELNEDTHFRQTSSRPSKKGWLNTTLPLFKAAVRTHGLLKGPVRGQGITLRSHAKEPFPVWMLESWYDSVTMSRLDDDEVPAGQIVGPAIKSVVIGAIDPNRSLADPSAMKIREELAGLVRSARGNIKRQMTSLDSLHTSTSWRIAAGMYEVAWPRFITSVTTIIDNASRRDIIFLCLDGMLYGAQLAFKLGFEKESKNFTDVLAQMSYSYKTEAEDIDFNLSPEDLQMDMVRGKYMEQEWVRNISVNGFANVNETCEMLVGVVDETRESVKAKLNLEKLREVYASWASDFRLVNPDREFVGQGQLSKVNSNGRITPYLFILFNDVFLYGDMTQCHHVIHLSVCHIIDIPDDYNASEDGSVPETQGITNPQMKSPKAAQLAKKTSLRNAFTIRSPRKEFVVLAANQQQKQLWINTLSKTIGDHLKAEKDLLEVRSKMQESDIKDRFDCCRLCLRSFSALRRRKYRCPTCKFQVCQDCSTGKLEMQQGKKKKKVKACDACCINKHEVPDATA